VETGKRLKKKRKKNTTTDFAHCHSKFTIRHKTTGAIDLEFVAKGIINKRIFCIYRNIVILSEVSLETEK
jgi:hypothetical protein